MVLYYATRHLRQSVGLEGPDLAKQRHQEILASALKDIPSDSIQQFDDKCFHVASDSRPGQFHVIKLDKGTCECEDFPRIHFCKHLAAIQVHFPHLFTDDIEDESSLPITQPPESSDQSQCVPRSESILTLTQEISTLQCKAVISGLSARGNLLRPLLPQITSDCHENECVSIALSSRIKLVR